MKHYHAGIPTQSSSQATIVGPFHRANGVPAFMASSRSSCLWVKLRFNSIYSLQKSIFTFSFSSYRNPPYQPDHQCPPYCLTEPSQSPHSVIVGSQKEELSRILLFLTSSPCPSSQIFFPEKILTLSSWLQLLPVQLVLVLLTEQRGVNPGEIVILY